MKYIILSVILLGLTGCTTPKKSSVEVTEKQSDSEIIELTILWSIEFDEVTWEPIELAKLLKDESRFKPAGNFYEVLDDTQAFGSNVTYLGLIGINFARGPNAVIQSTPEAIAQYITEKYGILLTPEPEEEAFVFEMGEDLQLVIVAHPNIEGSSMIIGEYTGL